jgi:hypothetical protein
MELFEDKDTFLGDILDAGDTFRFFHVYRNVG